MIPAQFTPSARLDDPQTRVWINVNQKIAEAVLKETNPELAGNPKALKAEVDKFVLDSIYKENNPILTHQEAKALIRRLFLQKEYIGPEPAVAFKADADENAGGYCPEDNDMYFGPKVRLSQIYHELAHYEGALDIAAACAYYRQLPFLKKLFIRAPKIQVEERLEMTAVTREWHRDPGRVELGYQTAKDIATSRYYAKRFRQFGKKEDYDKYETCREERIANLTGTLKAGNPLYGAYLKMVEQESAQSRTRS